MEENRIIISAVAISMLLHLLLGVATWRLKLLPDSDRMPHYFKVQEMEIELTPSVDLEKIYAEKDIGDPPEKFTSVPERTASLVPPEKKDYIGMYHTLASDLKDGQDNDTPSSEHEGMFQQVTVLQENVFSAGGVAYSTEASKTLDSGIKTQETGNEGYEKQEPKVLANLHGQWKIPAPGEAAGKKEIKQNDDDRIKDNPDLELWWGGQAPSLLKEGPLSIPGDRGFDFNQVELGMVGSGVVIDGNYSLNTYEWDWAPWIRRFNNELMHNWLAPYAYRLGIISGSTVIGIVVEKDGRASQFKILETDGHESLHEASLAAVRSFAPYAPLPPHFPEEKLVIFYTLGYPAWRH